MGVGRRPKPTAIKRLEGNPGKRPLNKHEPQPGKLVNADCPTVIANDKYARAEWERIAPVLVGMGVLTEADLTALAVYCRTCGEYWRAIEQMDREGGPLYVSPKTGYAMVSPLFSVAQRCADQMRRLMVEFGLTPAARVKLSVEPEEPSDEFDEWFENGK